MPKLFFTKQNVIRLLCILIILYRLARCNVYAIYVFFFNFPDFLSVGSLGSCHCKRQFHNDLTSNTKQSQKNRVHSAILNVWAT